MLERRVADSLRDLLGGLRAVLVHGPRQSGKTTLARLLARESGGEFVSLDDPAALEAARSDPVGFLEGHGRTLFLDEFQRGGDPLVLAIKAELDRTRAKGRFLMTGSTHFLSIPWISESLAGRVAIATLWPLSQGEIEGRQGAFLDLAFSDPESLRGWRGGSKKGDYLERICRGGFPEAHVLDPRQRDAWYAAYAETVIERDVAELAEVRDGRGLRTLLRAAAATSAQELVVKTLADGVGVKAQTASQWLGWMEAVFLLHSVPAWSRNPLRRAVRRPKLHLVDSGLAAHLTGKTSASLAHPTEPMTGPLLESFVVGELQRQAGWSECRPELFHLRERGGHEVDLILETRDGRIVAFEIKATSSRPAAGVLPLEALRQRLLGSSSRFVHGFVLYTGERAFPLGEDLTALPIDALWGAGA
jgi:uncharacterized protein